MHRLKIKSVDRILWIANEPVVRFTLIFLLTRHLLGVGLQFRMPSTAAAEGQKFPDQYRAPTLNFGTRPDGDFTAHSIPPDVPPGSPCFLALTHSGEVFFFVKILFIVSWIKCELWLEMGMGKSSIWATARHNLRTQLGPRILCADMMLWHSSVTKSGSCPLHLVQMFSPAIYFDRLQFCCLGVCSGNI